MAKSQDFFTVITVDADRKEIVFSSQSGADSRIVLDRQRFNTRLFDKEFYTVFADKLDKYAKAHPAEQNQLVNIVLPDYLFSLDTISVPTIRWKKVNDSLQLKIEENYKNKAELKISNQQIASNRQFTTFMVAAIRQEIVTQLYSQCASARITPKTLTFAANASVDAVCTLSQKLRQASYLLLDIKHDYARFVFVDKGVTSGFYKLPFGYDILSDNKVVAEDMLFDTSRGDLLVLNAKEKAKAKQLTMSAATIAQQKQEDEEEEDAFAAPKIEEPVYEEDDPLAIKVTETNEPQSSAIKALPKKTPRKLPKYMQRELPQSEDEFVAENFRIFEKWALNLLQENKKLFLNGAPEAVYVNMPERFADALLRANREDLENGIKFLPLEIETKEGDVKENLETYGGFCTDNYNKGLNF